MVEYDVNMSCDWLIRYLDSPLITDECRQRLYQVTDAAKKYIIIKENLK